MDFVNDCELHSNSPTLLLHSKFSLPQPKTYDWDDERHTGPVFTVRETQIMYQTQLLTPKFYTGQNYNTDVVTGKGVIVKEDKTIHSETMVHWIILVQLRHNYIVESEG